MIPAILASIIVVAGVFAFVPVEKASTVHSTLQANIDEIDRAYPFSFNQTYKSATEGGLTILPAQTGITYSGTFILNAIANNKTSAGSIGAKSLFECGLKWKKQNKKTTKNILQTHKFR